MTDLAQHVIVTIVAILAAGVILRRVFATVQAGPAASKCASCPAHSQENAGDADAAREGSGQVHPLILVKPQRR
jgi:hypothetical protein